MIVAGWALVVCGLSIALSQVPTLRPDLAVLAVGALIALAGGLIVCDRSAGGHDR